MRAIKKDFFRQVKNTLNRFISLVLIVMLGVAFYTGIRSTEPDMRLSADKVYDDGNMMDIRITGALGVTKEDVDAVATVDNVQQAEGAYSIDAISQYKGKEIVVHYMNYSDKVNTPRITAGDIPKKNSECIIDSNYAKSNNISVGDIIEVCDDNIKGDRYTITGFFTLSAYPSIAKGSTNIGTGQIDALVILPGNQFEMDCYTDIYVLLKGAKQLLCYDAQYEELVERIKDDIEDNVATKQAKNRYNSIYNEAESKIDAAQSKLDKKKVDYNEGIEKLKEAKTELIASQDKLSKAKTDITNNQVMLEKEKEKYLAGLKKYNALKRKYKTNKSKYDKSLVKYTSGMKAYNKGNKKYHDSIKQMTDMGLSASDAQASLKSEREQLDSTKEQLDVIKKKLDVNKIKLDTAKNKLGVFKTKLNRARSQIKLGYGKLSNAKQQIKASEKKIKQAEQKISKLENKLRKAEKKLKKAQTKIDKNRNKLEDIEDGKWYILDRNQIQSYVEYDQDADRIGKIGTVFPAIFFLVAAMVSLTTMTRMVEEERIQIGTLKALGYNKIHIAAKYLAYGSLATIVGGGIGGIIGSKAIPYVIMSAYKMLYANMYAMIMPLNMNYYFLAFISAFVSVAGATVISCFNTLKSQPAQLMRPVAPKEGKRVLLERIPFIWRHLGFNMKSTFRNLFRYKKRLIMTLFGISGCMALLLVGFGVKNSVNSILTKQFGELFLYDAVVNYDENVAEKQGTDHFKKEIESDARVKKCIEINQFVRDVGTDEKKLSTIIIVAESAESNSDMVIMRDRITKERYRLKDDRVIITEKLAKELGVSKGDTINIRESDTENYTVKVDEVIENYCYHYLYMTKNTYEKLYGKSIQMNSAILIMNEKHMIDDSFGEKMLKVKGISGVSFIGATYNKFEDMLKGLNSIVYVLVIAAGALAFIVLYNLNNINIAERRRELATLKVLGFYDGEVAGYVYRENFIITTMGIALGVILGYFLHQYVIQTAEVNMVMFGREIGVTGYILSIIITILFAIIINAAMYFKLKKVDMAASLKSGE